jgi:hypothetical protein
MGSSSFSRFKFGSDYGGVLARLAWRTRLGFRELPRGPEAPGRRADHQRD